MCGRFVIVEASAEMARLFEAMPANDLPTTPNYNVCPTDEIHVVTSDEGSRRLRAMRWGFLPHWYKSPAERPLLINARAETVAEKPAFRVSVRERRCLVPASGFYEWTKDDGGRRLPWYIRRRSGEAMALAGIWQEWSHEGTSLATCAIVTTAANAAMSRIHHRMPVLVAREDWPLWLGEAGRGAALLMRPAPDDALCAWRVGERVNSNRAEGAGLIEACPA